MKLKSKSVRVVAAAALALSAVAGFSALPAHAAARPVIAVITHGDNGSFWSVAKKGAEAAGRALGVKVNYEGSNNDAQKQAQLIDAAVTAKVSGIAISVPNVSAIKASVARAIAAGIPVITLNSGSNDYLALGAITHVGQDESVAGAGAGTKLKAAGAMHLLCVIHEQGNSGLEQRCSGAKTTFGGTVDNMKKLKQRFDDLLVKLLENESDLYYEERIMSCIYKNFSYDFIPLKFDDWYDRNNPNL